MIDVNLAPAMAIRVNFVGELGWELHHPIEYQNHIFDALMAAGAEFGLKPFGIRAMDAMRLEKSYRLVGTELSIEYAALESGLHRFVHLNKGDFKGQRQLAEWQERGFANAMVTLEVHDTTDADAIGGNPINDRRWNGDWPRHKRWLRVPARQVAGIGNGSPRFGGTWNQIDD